MAATIQQGGQQTGDAVSGQPTSAVVPGINDTLVTRATAEAYSAARTPQDSRLSLRRSVSADFQHHTYIHDAITAVFMVSTSEMDARDGSMRRSVARGQCTSSSGSRRTARELAKIHPVLYPQQRA